MPHVPEEAVSIRPIGVVVADFCDFEQKTNYEDIKEICIRKDLELGLTGLEHFSHIYVFYHQHRRKEWQQAVGWSDSPEQILTMPFSDKHSCKGIYTSRAPARPSGIGSCVCELVRREGNRLFVRGLDAFNGSSVLDIKIYLPRYDSVPQASGPFHCRTRRGAETMSQAFHWGTMNVGVTLGLRTGLRAMKELGLSRGEATRAEVVGGNFFAQGIEGVTGCTLLRAEASLQERTKAATSWRLRLLHGGEGVEIRLREHPEQGADEVLTLPDERLFTEVRILQGQV